MVISLFYSSFWIRNGVSEWFTQVQFHSTASSAETNIVPNPNTVEQ